MQSSALTTAGTNLQQVLEKVRKLRGANPNQSRGRNAFRKRGVEATPDFYRIAALESRNWEERFGQELSKKMTPLLRSDRGEQELRDIQAVSLHDLAVYGCCVSFTRVGGGKTLMLLLAPYVVQAFRPLMLIPADLREKTERDIAEYKRHWRIPNFIRIEHYEILSHRNHRGLLDDYRPDLILMDEASAMKDPQAICTKQMNYYVADCEKYGHYPDPRFLITSGTLTNDSILNYWHLMKWGFDPDLLPMPQRRSEVEQWSLCLDDKVSDMSRVKPGALLELCNDEERKIALTNPLKAARLAYRRRLISTPGVVSTTKTFQGASLRVKEFRREVPAEIRAAVARLRDDFERPDGEWLEEGQLVAACIKTLALGFYYVWDPMPPAWWLEPRKEWHQTCRKLIKNNRKRLDSESMIREAMLDKGLYPQHRKKLDAWMKVEKEFTPRVKTIWVHDFAIQDAIRWGKKNKGIIWTYYKAFAERLAKESGFTYYHHKGYSADGKYIEAHTRGSQEPCIASFKSNFKGKNLQFITNKCIGFGHPASGDWWEQWLGRAHRDLQPEDYVQYEFYSTCKEHIAAVWQARASAEYIQDTTDQEQKLIFGDILVPTLDDVELTRKGIMWHGKTFQQDDAKEMTE